MVEDQGFKALEAKNADEALKMLAQHPEIDLLFTDIDMPGTLDGLMLAHTVREKWPHIAIVVVSGHRRPGTDDLPSGGRFLSKPYLRAAVMAALRQTLANAAE